MILPELVVLDGACCRGCFMTAGAVELARDALKPDVCGGFLCVLGACKEGCFGRCWGGIQGRWGKS